jgi:hypothetical protein
MTDLNQGPCLIPGCENVGTYNIGIRLRRRNTKAVWAPNTRAFLCGSHAAGGCLIEINIVPDDSKEIQTKVYAMGKTAPKERTTPIVQNARTKVVL